jgi:hypothetical protein
MQRKADMKIGELRFDEEGLVPAVVQEEDTGEVLIQGFMNRRRPARDAGQGAGQVLVEDQTGALDQGRNLRQPLAARADPLQLREQLAAGQSPPRRRRRLPHRPPHVLLP